MRKILETINKVMQDENHPVLKVEDEKLLNRITLTQEDNLPVFKVLEEERLQYFENLGRRDDDNVIPVSKF